MWRADDPSARHRPPLLVPAVVDLDELTEELVARATDDETRRAAHVVVSLPDLRTTIVALAAEAELADTEPRNGASLQVLVGSVTLRTGDQQIAVAPGQLVAVPAQLHSIRAEEDSALLLTVPLT